MRFVIVGNSAAGINAAETIRKLLPTQEITIISDEPHPYYSRCLTSYYIGGEIQEQGMIMCDPDYYERNNFRTLFGRKAVGLEPREKHVVLDDGGIENFDCLLIATGGSPTLPDIPGVNKKGVFTLRTWDDAKEIVSRAGKSKKALVAGGGMIGMKAATALHECGLEVRIVVSSDRIMSQMLDRDSSDVVRAHLEDCGFLIDTGTDIVEITGGDEVEGARLKDGRQVECQLIVVGKGVEPNLSLVAGTGVKVHRGILVDSHMETSIPGIYAAGDVVEGFDLVYGEPRVNALWTAATLQGEVAGSNMAGVEMDYPGSLVMNSVDLLGLAVVSIGIASPRGEGYEILSRTKGRGWYRRLVLKDNVLKGAVLIGEIENAGVILSLIKKQVDVSRFKDRLVEDDFTFATFFDDIGGAKKKYFEAGGKRNVQTIMQGGY